jgi:hypothetical protein
MATNPPLVHYALDLENPPLIACDSPDVTAWGATTEPTKVTCPDCMSHEEFPRVAVLLPRKITAKHVLVEAASLIGGDGENPEYERAIVELTSLLIGAGLDDTTTMTLILRALAQGA